MATNDFLVFAGAGGANVISQAQYQALLAETTGFQSGIASSSQVNKVFRQSSIMAAMIGQFIADKSGQNAVDDGTIATLEANFILALQAATFVKLGATLNLYVNPSSGVDSNNGTSPTSAFRTIQAAAISAYTSYNFNNNSLNINLAAGTYTSPVALLGMPIGCTAINLIGNTSSPSSVVLNITNGVAIFGNIGVNLTVSGMSVQASGSGANGYGILSQQSTMLISNCILNSCGFTQIQSNAGGLVNVASSTFQGTSQYSMAAVQGGAIQAASTTLTYSGAVYTSATVAANMTGTCQLLGTTFAGSATGSRYNAATNGVIFTNGAGANFIPGNSAGVATTGLYV